MMPARMEIHHSPLWTRLADLSPAGSRKGAQDQQKSTEDMVEIDTPVASHNRSSMTRTEGVAVALSAQPLSEARSRKSPTAKDKTE